MASSGASAFASCPAEPNDVPSTASIEENGSGKSSVTPIRWMSMKPGRPPGPCWPLFDVALRLLHLTVTPSSRPSPGPRSSATSASGRRERSASTHRTSTTTFCRASQAAPSPRSTTRTPGAGSPRFALRPRQPTILCRFSPSSRPGRTTATTPRRVSEVPHDEPVDEMTTLSTASTRFMGLMTEIPGRTGSRSMTRSTPDLKRSGKRPPNDPYRTEIRGIASFPLRAACTKCPPVTCVMLTSPPAG